MSTLDSAGKGTFVSEHLTNGRTKADENARVGQPRPIKVEPEQVVAPAASPTGQP